ncbi:uncharacterized protein BDW43DRAFT_305581 [Aspergillus alliaceus]|uniref:uncharacterized protein n=1 Tax=Petromyces alliaceus TaxID=209559 RepID=UPI0012A58845|nr:uncharacterized protein BDW43DRAFT_305581 [Aspergillus alliaceus]KAB8239818.1 hypothetical protein BDW43DRAFT_305581 [Aspergillus alliaceus]
MNLADENGIEYPEYAQSLLVDSSCNSTDVGLEECRRDDKFYASGCNCDITSQEKTIAGVINKWMHGVDSGKLCHTECLRITLGEPYSAWLNVGSKDGSNANACCGTRLNFDHCISGGNNDI